VVIKELAACLGQKLTAYIAGVADARAVVAWAVEAQAPRDPIPERLKFALTIARMISEHEDRFVAQAWFQGLNPQLDDWSPARLLREGDLDEVGPSIRAAARAFLVGG
jgi:hypothetical protein